MLNKIQVNMQKLIQFISASIALFVLATILFTKLNREGTVFDFSGKVFLEDYTNNVLLFLLAAIGGLIWFKKIKDKNENNMVLPKWQLAIASLGLFVVQVFFVYHIFFYTGNDALNIRIAAEKFVDGEFDLFYNLEYFQTCPNNLMLYIIYIFAYYLAKVIGFGNGYILLVGFSIVLTNIAVLLAALTVYKLTEDRKIMWLSYGISVLLFGITPWLSVPYTDVLSITTPIFSFYLYISIRDKKISGIIKWFFIFFVPFFMYGLKPLNIIICIAILLCEVLYFDVTRESVKTIVSVMVAFVTTLLVVSSIQIGIEKLVGYQEDKDKELSLAWILLLGSDDTTYGQWSYENLQYVLQYTSYEERQEELLETVGERYYDMGFVGVMKHWANKIHMFYMTVILDGVQRDLLCKRFRRIKVLFRSL